MRQAIDGGRQFCCSKCGLIVNADYNAAMNLVRKLGDDFKAYERYGYDRSEKSWQIDGRRVSSKVFWEDIKAKVQQALNSRFKQPRDTAPAGGWPRDFETGAFEKTPW